MAPQLSHLLAALLLLFLVFESFPNGESRTLKPESHSLNFPQNLEGSYKGQTVKSLQELKRYLINFGYLNYNDPKSTTTELTDEFDELLESALKTYQKNYHLKVTGLLDSDTIKEMTVKRCGNPDIIHHNTSKTSGHKSSNKLHTVAHFSFFNGRPKWLASETHLTYTVPSSSVPVVSLEVLRPILSRAFKRWADVSQFTFEEATGGAQADIQIGFYRGEHGDQNPFDGRGNGLRNVLAHAFAPRDGRFHYDADENWSTNPGPSEVDLESVAVHEIGHLLGLGHSQDRNAIMFAEIPSGTVKRNLNQDDINGIRTLYSS